jgi:glycosyltransferase involved in cell wall biosynthesis
VGVLVPCYNKDAAIADAVPAFRSELPDSVVYVYDNNSTDTITDMLSGYRAFSRRFVKSFPVLSAR